jgi:hypothetical protein
MTQINILLGILSVKTNLVRRLTKVRGARHARVAIGHVDSARVTRIPIGIMLDYIGKRLLLDVGLCRGPTRNVPSRWTVPTIHHRGRGRTVWGNAACSIALETSWKNRGYADGAGHGGRKTALGVTSNIGWRATAAPLHAGVVHT